jgi:protein TonB
MRLPFNKFRFGTRIAFAYAWIRQDPARHVLASSSGNSGQGEQRRLERDQCTMATFDQPSDLANCIAYPTFQRPGSRIDSRVAAFSPNREEQLPASSGQERIEDSLFREIEPGAKRNPYAAVASIALQTLVLATLVIAPLYFTETMPKTRIVTRLYLQAPPAASPTATTIQAPASTFTPKSISIPNPLHKTPEAPTAPATTPAPTPVGTIGGVVGGVPGGVVGGIPSGVLSEVMGSTRAVPAKASDPLPVKRVRVPARIAEANLIYDVPPKYPAEAGQARIEGTVVLVAVIGKDGSVQDVRVESGLQMLAQAAVNAVKQWRYKPYMLNGEPVEVDSRITINFALKA